MPKMITNGINTHYWQHGKGPDMVMVHGLVGNMAVWHMGVLPLLQREFRITTYDVRGHGATDVPPTGYTTGDMVEDLRSLMDGLNIERAYLVGHSMGADVALHFALRYPKRVMKIAAIEGMFFPLAQLYRAEDSVVWSFFADLFSTYANIEIPPEHKNDIAYLISRSSELPMMYGPLKGQFRNMEPINRLVYGTTILEEIDKVSDYTLESLERIRTPVLLLYEDNSLLIETYQALFEHLPNCIGAILPYAKLKHAMLYEHPEIVVGCIKEFIRSGTVPAALAIKVETREQQ